MTRRFLEVDDLSASALERVLQRAIEWKADPAQVDPVLEGRGVAALFEKPSTRTRVSFEMAIHTLGGHPISLRGDEVGFGSRETPSDIARVLGTYCTVLGARVFDHDVLIEMADTLDPMGVACVNLLSDRAHPCQALADLMTVLESYGSLEGRRVAYVGDGNNVAASLATGAALTGVEVVVSSPPGYELDDDAVARVRSLGGMIELHTDPHEAVQGADVVYTDVWTSMGQEEESATRRAAFQTHQVNEALMDAVGRKTLFLHCLPAHRGEEVVDAVIDGPQSAVWQQAENRMHAVRSLLVELRQEEE